MGNTYTRQNTTEEKNKQHDEKRNTSGEKQTLPNSVVSRMMALPGAEGGPGDLSEVPNSVVSRIMELPKAEAEADRLSEGVTSGTPSSVRREMGGRLGADFSGVRFHSGPSSARQSEAMGAQAWTQGRDVYFGKSGFTPSLAAHELVHTVQQGAVRGNVSQSMPAGSVQLKTAKQKQREKINPGLVKATSKDFELTNDDDPLPGDVGELTALEAKLASTFATSRGLNIYNAIRFDLDEMISSKLTSQLNKKDDGKRFHVKFRPKTASFFLVRAAYQDYALRDILTELVWKGAGLFKTNVRIRQYKALIKSISDRLGPYQVRELASQAGMIQEEPRAARKGDTRQVNKRSYELDVEDPEADKFNPGNIPEVATIQEEIDNAKTFQEAYKIFARFTGNDEATIEYEIPELDEGEVEPDLVLFKNKLKHMSRQVWDYPELRNKIGNLLIADSEAKTHMGVQRTSGGRQKTDVYYNAFHDRSGAEGEKERADEAKKIARNNEWNGDFDHNGNHELGHLLAFNMPMRNETLKEGEESSQKSETENDIIKEVLLNRDILTPKQKEKIKYYSSDGYHQGKYKKLKHYSGQVDLEGSAPLRDSEISSGYGRSAVYEFFAETFADTYTHGTNAKRTSQEVVKEYEKRQKELQQKKFKYNQSNWFMKLFRKKVTEPETYLPSDTVLKRMKKQREAEEKGKRKGK